MSLASPHGRHGKGFISASRPALSYLPLFTLTKIWCVQTSVGRGGTGGARRVATIRRVFFSRDSGALQHLNTGVELLALRRARHIWLVLLSMAARGVAWARYLRKVHCEWMPFNAKAQSPIFLQRVSCKRIIEANAKLDISKQIMPQPGKPGELVDRTHLTFADGTSMTLDLNGMRVEDIVDEIDIVNGRLVQEESKRGKPFA